MGVSLSCGGQLVGRSVRLSSKSCDANEFYISSPIDLKFACACVMRCRCAGHNFHTRHFTNYGVIAPYSTPKIL